MRLDGTSVAITGAGQGIGRAAALALAASGARVVVNDIDAGAAADTVAEIEREGGVAVAAVAAIGPTEGAEAVVERARMAFGGLDAMICNAGILRDRVLWKTEDDDFDAVIETHLRGTFTCARAAARLFRDQGRGGRLVLVSSIAGQRGNFGQTAYSAAKAGIAAMARTWSLELARDRVTVNAVVPNALTRMTATIPQLAPHLGAMERGEPLPRRLREDVGVGSADDVAPAFVWLCSAAAADVTGQCIGIGGDRLSLWAHPTEAAFELRDAGWSADAIAETWRTRLAARRQSVGVDIDI